MSSSPSGATAAGGPEAGRALAAGIRTMGVHDLPACADVFYTALDRLSEVRHEAPVPRNEASVLRLYARLVASHPAGSAVAEFDGRIIGFGIAVEREGSWFLGFLFVEPAWQAEGVGRRILERILPASGVDAWLAGGGSLATCAEAIQLTSTGLYTSLGMRPRDPIYMLVGTPRSEMLGPLSPSIEGLPFELLESTSGAAWLDDELAPLDLAAVGHRRPIDHRDDRTEGRQGVLFRDRGDGRALGYGYVQPSGRIGPAYVIEPELLEGIIGDLIGRVRPAGAWQ
ncbi:MAG TPA: GNAT family N-acetyltransferase, partial [Candidatus Saccharimonadia bacterium]|nr:GNAT family N-acetyltransferase [Candidatus Saccharimonadia bacterium]